MRSLHLSTLATNQLSNDGPHFLLIQSLSDAKPAAGSLFPAHSPLAPIEIQLALAVIAFGLLMTCAAIYMLKNVRVPASEVIRLLALMMVVTGVLVLVAAGLDPQQIAPAFGILGTVAGYLLGRGDRTQSDNRFGEDKDGGDKDVDPPGK